MKKFIIIAALALATALTGCKYDNSSPSYFGSFKISHSEVTGQNSLLTNYEYDNQGRLSGEEQILNGSETVYEDTDYTYNITSTPQVRTFYRTTHKPTLAEYKHVLQSKVVNGSAIVLSNEVFLVSGGGNETVPVEYYRMTPDPMLPDLRKSREEILEGGVLTVNDNFNYNENVLSYDKTVTNPAEGGTAVKMSVMESYFDSGRAYPRAFTTTRDGKVVEYQLFLTNGGGGTQMPDYRIYRGTEISVSGSGEIAGGGTMVEERNNVRIKDDDAFPSVSWTVTKYDAEGKNPVATEYEDVYEVRQFSPTN